MLQFKAMKGWKRNFVRDDNRAHKLRFNKRMLKSLRAIKTWQLLSILLVFVMLSAIFLRLNNLDMMDRREALEVADKTGDIAKIERAAKELQNFVAHHMNADTGRVPLQTLYNQAALEAVNASRPPEISTDIYQQVTEECMPQLRNYGYSAWANCIAERVGISEITDLDQNNQNPPDPDAFYVIFSSPRWSFDFAGISLLIVFLLIFAILFRLIFIIILRIILKIKYKSVKF